jgi:AcrR family transcriptional regulator/DNA-binding MarR family transcriptional regulator
MASSAGRISKGHLDGGTRVSGVQRARLLGATFEVVAEQGYGGLTARKVVERAGVSPKTFYELFTDREDCFLAAFEHAIGELVANVLPSYEAEREWVARVRGGLAVLLEILEWEPALRRLVFVEALAGGPRVLARRAHVLEQLTKVIDGGREGMRAPEELPGMVAEGVVGATFGVIHARLSQERPGPLIELLGQLMAMIVLPYRGGKAAAKELARPIGKAGPDFLPADQPAKSGRPGENRRIPRGSISPVDFRLTIRTQMVLAAVAEYAGVNNREVSELVGVADQGQISRLMARLLEQGLIENTRGHGQGAPKAWRLTPQGKAVIDAHQGERTLIKEEYASTHGGKLAAKRGRPRGQTDPAPLPAEGLDHSTTDQPAHPPGRGTSSPGQPGKNSGSRAAFRMTVRTHRVLTAIAELGERELAPSSSNVEIAKTAGITDQAQISRLLRRLEGHGLLANTGGATAGIANAWQLTTRGEEALHTSRPLSGRTA